MANFQLSISIDDAEIEKDFYNVIAAQNPQALKDAVGVDGDDAVTISDKERKDFVTGLLTQNIVESYLASKSQQAAQAFFATHQDSHKDTITPVKPPIKREKS